MLGFDAISGFPISGLPTTVGVAPPPFSTNTTGSYADKSSFDFDALAYVKFGDVDGLQTFLYENARQHQVFYEMLADKGIATPLYPIADADPSNLDDWLFVHNEIHQRLASQLGLANPFNLLDSDWRVEDDFYDWLSSHESIHRQIENALVTQ